MPDKTQAEISYSLLEYTSEFKRPILEGITVPAKLISGVLDALQPLGYGLDGVELNTQVRKLDEYSIVFSRTTPARQPTRNLTLGLGKVHIVAENLDWTEAEQFISVHRAALTAIRELGGAEFQSQHLVVGMHIQIKERPRKDVTAPLVSPIAHQLVEGDADFPGVILVREKTVVVIDASLAFANGIFVRIARRHPPQTPLEEVAAVLRNDEQRIFDGLGLEGLL
jgi:hypothetical protein